jgi:LysM repeat protein/N-acetylmuramoyl-L-alanine amidase
MHYSCQNSPSKLTDRLYSMIALCAALGMLVLCGECGRCYGKGTDEAFTHLVRRDETLSEIAQEYGVSVNALRRWNDLRGDTIFVGQRLQVAAYPPPDGYVVKSGDTLSEIALQFNIPICAIRQLNGVTRDRIYPGQRLRLRDEPGRPQGNLVHKVKRDDTLWGIAQQYGLNVSELKELNGLTKDIILPGMRLIVSAATEDFADEGSDQFEYIVRNGDSLAAIAERFDVGVGLLQRLNQIEGDRIYPGQKLQLRPSSLEEGIHVVRYGETLSSIAAKYDVDLQKLRQINGIANNKILAGQKLRLRRASGSTHIVERGDALWEIARAYGMTVAGLRQINGLSSDRIYPGQELRLDTRESQHFQLYTVKNGDYLGRIARLHQMSVSELMEINVLDANIIHPGEKLKVNPILAKSTEWVKISEIDWDDLIVSIEGVGRIGSGNGPYFYTRPRAQRQIHAEYYEGPTQTTLQTYRQAQKLWDAFEVEVGRLGCLSNTLDGWHFVLDPGHGGQDPGAVVKALDGNGNSVYVVEDEYAYDVSLRVYVLLRLHGAQVTMTLLSPNHLIRNSDPPRMTFVNEKNEVYNSYELNKSGRWKNWPIGGRNGNLSSRVLIAREAFKGVRKDRCIFLSFHADIDPNVSEAPVVLYYRSRDGRRSDTSSKKFAKTLLPFLGAGAEVRGQALGVLRDNPAQNKVLFELRNLAYTDNVWALRFEELRHRDAEKVIKGILAYVKSRTVIAQRSGK